MLRRILDRTHTGYLRGQLEARDANQTKKALQEICRLYRSVYRVHPEQLYAIQNYIIGLTFSSSDTKVRRWALNSLAQFGIERECREAVMHALQSYREEPEVLAAAVAALYRISNNAAADLQRLGFDKQMVTLAALQHIPASNLDLASLPLRVEKADEELIKLGLLVVGLQKAPPNMFDPNYDNSQIVRVLGRHHNPIVSQYAIWAITENPTLGVRDLGVDLKQIESQPPNVRAWIFQLLAMESSDSDQHIEYVKLGIEDDNVDARAGLAFGLRETFSCPLVPVVLEWFTREYDQHVRQLILDHLVRQSNRSIHYTQYAIDEFERMSPGSPVRERMLINAAGKEIFSNLSQIMYGGGHDLLGGMRIMDNRKTINIGTVQAGAVAIDGNATNAGTSNVFNAVNIEEIRSQLTQAEQEIKSSPIDNVADKKVALAAIEAAKAEPTKNNLSRALSAMENISSVASRIVGSATTLAPIIEDLGRKVGLL